MKKITKKDLADNPIKRLACCLVLDTSHSMTGAPLMKLKEGLKLFLDTILENPKTNEKIQLAIVTFGHSDFSPKTPEGSRSPKEGVKQILDFDIDWRGMDVPNFSADGFTPLGEAVEFGLDLLLKQKEVYRETSGTYEQPWMVIMTDGKPYDCQWKTNKFGKYLHEFGGYVGIDENGKKVKNSISDIANETSELVSKEKLNLISVAIGDDADPKIIKTFAPTNKVLKINNLNFSEFFRFFSATLADPSQGYKPGEGIDVEELL